MTDQLLVKGKEVKLYLELVPECLFTKSTKPSKLEEINPTFDTQNMPKDAYNKAFTRLIQLTDNLVFYYADNKVLNRITDLGTHK